MTPDADSKILDGAAAIAVGAESHDFFPKGKHIGNCTLKDKEVRGRVTRFTSNCDAGQGASGGAILSANLKNPTFLGITVSGSETSEQVEQAMRTRKPHRGKYDLANWRTTHVPLNGAFLASVLEGMSM